MTLSFPNQAASLMRRGVPSDLGHEIARWRRRFFINADALKRSKPDVPLDEDFSAR
jgi:hypothetical protein